MSGASPWTHSKPSGPFSEKPSRWVIVSSAMLNMDKVFDRREACAVEQAMIAHTAPAWAVAAVLREQAGQRAWPIAAGVSCNEPMALEKGPTMSNYFRPPRP